MLVEESVVLVEESEVAVMEASGAFAEYWTPPLRIRRGLALTRLLCQEGRESGP